MIADFLAQSAVLLMLLTALRYRHMLDDFGNGNVCRLEREEADAAEAKAWLDAMEAELAWREGDR